MVPLVFFPGAGGLASFWEPVAQRVRDLGPQVLLGYPGFEPGMPADPAIANLGDLERWCRRRLPEGPCHVVAQSMGGVMALHLALEAPERVATLTLTGTAGGVDVTALGAIDWRPNFRLERPDVPAWFEQDRTDVTAHLGQIRAPTLILHGDRDPICPPAVAAFFAARLPCARRVVIRGGTHSFAKDLPDEVAALLRAHVSQGEDQQREDQREER